jgi:hypothetical protein
MIALLLVSAALAGPGDPGWEPVIEDDPYRFCHTPGVEAGSAREWCDLLDDAPPDRCKGLRETCAGAPDKNEVDPWEAMRGCTAGDRPARDFSKPEAPREPVEAMQCQQQPPPQAGAASAILRWVIAILVAVALLLLLRLVWQWVGSLAPRDKKLAAAATARVEVVVTADDVPELPSDDLLSAARRALAEGRTGEAVLLARGAALRRLGEAGKVVLHRARTDREYVRSVRKDPEIEAPLRDVVRAVEIWRWGGRLVSADVAKGAIDAVERIVAKLGAAALLLLAIEQDAAANRYGPYGDAALHPLYEEAGYDVSWRLRGLRALGEGDGPHVLVLDIDAVELDPEDHEALRAWVTGGGLLVVGGDSTAVFPELGEIAGTTGLEGDTDALLELATVFGSAVRRTSAAPRDLPVPAWPMGPDRWFRAPQGTAWIEADFPEGPAKPVVVAFGLGEGAVIAFADDLLLRNAALVAPSNEAFLVLAPYAAHDVGFVDLPVPAAVQLATRAGSDADNPWQSLQKAHLLPLVLQIMLVSGLVVLWRGWPFAPLRDPPEEGRIAFADHVRALGVRWMRVGASRRALSAQARLWLTRLGAQGLEAAARRSGRDAAAAHEWVMDLEEAAANPGGPNKPTDLERMEELWKITQRS